MLSSKTCYLNFLNFTQLVKLVKKLDFKLWSCRKTLYSSKNLLKNSILKPQKNYFYNFSKDRNDTKSNYPFFYCFEISLAKHFKLQKSSIIIFQSSKKLITKNVDLIFSFQKKNGPNFAFQTNSLVSRWHLQEIPRMWHLRCLFGNQRL